jgi:Domain of unknown function (DUF2437).
MKLARYTHDGKTSVGLVQGNRVINLDHLLPASAPADVAALLARADALADARTLQATAENAWRWSRCGCTRPFCVRASSWRWA